MTSGHFEQARIYIAVCVLAVMVALALGRAQSQESANGATMQGYVCDSDGRPVANAIVFLQLSAETQTLPAHTEIAHTDSMGAYRFAALRAGAYILRAEMNGYGVATAGPVSLASEETKKMDFVLAPRKASEPQGALPKTPATGKSAQAPQFFDEPQFTVAGVTQATSAGGHGSDNVLRTTEALAKATVSLGNEPGGGSNVATAATERSLRGALASTPKDPALHHRLGDVEEKLGNPLEAVREYQRAAELDPSEPNLFDWGSELLTHRALEAATVVFTKGNRLFPKSARMLIALGVTWYARGSCDRATQYLVNASDLAPGNATPYLFLGKMQSVENALPEGSLERLARFAQLQPDNALANYYYAVGLWKKSAGSADSTDSDAERTAHVQSLLQKAVQLDPKLGAAYLQLGILYSQREDFPQAISAYQKAIEVSAELDVTLEEAHYRLAQTYRRTGDKEKAKQELQLHDELAKKTKQNRELGRREVQEFVISLQDKNPAPQPQP